MKRAEIVKRLREAAKARGLYFSVEERTRHGQITVGNTSKTLGRHREINDVTARKFFDQFAEELGKGWWR